MGKYNRIIDEEPTETYRGAWFGSGVEFPRVFRGYRFSDEECEALCRGEMIEVHGLVQNEMKYAVAGSLQRSRYPGFQTSFETVAFRAAYTVPYNPEYVFHPADRRPVAPQPDVVQSDVFQEMDDDSLSVGDQMEASVRAAQYPTVVQVSVPGKRPLFIPVFELLSEEKLQAAAAKAAAMA